MRSIECGEVPSSNLGRSTKVLKRELSLTVTNRRPTSSRQADRKLFASLAQLADALRSKRRGSQFESGAKHQTVVPTMHHKPVSFIHHRQHASLAQLADALRLERRGSQFESGAEHHNFFLCFASAIGRCAPFRSERFPVRIWGEVPSMPLLR